MLGPIVELNVFIANEFFLYIHVNPFMADNTIVCVRRLEYVEHITMHVVQKKHFFKIFRNVEANASGLLENIEEMFLC